LLKIIFICYNSYVFANTTLYFKNLLMENDVENIDDSIKKVEAGVIDCLKWKYKNNGLILDYLEKREIILNITREEIIGLNFNNLISWQEKLV